MKKKQSIHSVQTDHQSFITIPLQSASSIIAGDIKNGIPYKDSADKTNNTDLMFEVDDLFSIKSGSYKSGFTKSTLFNKKLTSCDNPQNTIKSKINESNEYSMMDKNLKMVPEVLEKDELIYDESIQIIKMIGKGAQGTVYLARIVDEDLSNQLVAVKRYVIPELKQADGQKILEEYEALKSLDSQFIVKYYDIEFYTLYNTTVIHLIMEYIEGFNLKQFLEQSERKFSITNAKIIGRCILQGLDYLHSCGIIHRDLKVSLILMNSRKTFSYLQI